MDAGAFQAVTIGVRDIDAALRLFRDIIGLDMVYDISAGADVVAAWQLPAGTRLRLVELANGDYPIGRLRLAQVEPAAMQAMRLDDAGGDSPLDIGPKAVDFYVYKSLDDAMVELEAAGCVARSKPIRHTGASGMDSEELVLTGPDGVPFLIMVGHSHPPSSKRGVATPTGYSEVPTQSIVVGDPAVNQAFYGDAMGLVTGTDNDVPAEMLDDVNDLTGVPRGTKMRFTVYQEAGEPSGKYLLVHFFDASTTRLTDRMKPGNLGVSLFTHDTDDLDGLLARTKAAGGTLVGQPAVATFGDTASWRIALVRGPNEELFEFRERR